MRKLFIFASFNICILTTIFASLSTTAMAQDGETRQVNKTITIGDSIEFRGITHASVGLEYVVEYDNEAFDSKISSEFVYKDRANAPGGDRENVIYVLFPKKVGNYQVTAYDNFRGMKQNVIITNIHISDGKARSLVKTKKVKRRKRVK